VCACVEEPDEVCYDAKYALRVCLERGLHAACVHIYTTMGLYDEAVELALQFDTDLAKRSADKPDPRDVELRRKLWLKIARHVVEKERDVQHAMTFLQDCAPLLKIEDVLPFFPDFVTIDRFKSAICASLDDYGRHIDQLRADMDDATESAREIRADARALRRRAVLVRSHDKCAACRYPLTMRAYYVFPCAHRFHADCLVAELLPHLPGGVRARAADLQRRLAAASHDLQASPASQQQQQAGVGGPDAGEGGSASALKAELDELVAAECLYCGDLMIRLIDRPFISDEQYDDVVRSWL